MEIPFVFGKIAVGKNFTGRSNELALLVQQLRSLSNTAVIAPRRWGKSSLIALAVETVHAADPELIICRMDLGAVRTRREFLQLLCRKVFAATVDKWEDVAVAARRFLAPYNPRVSVGTNPGDMAHGGAYVELDWDAVEQDPSALLDLCEHIAEALDARVALCIDEFQNVCEFENCEAFLHDLQRAWQAHQHVGYCLSSVRRPVIIDMLNNPKRPLYRFGTLMFLSKPDAADLVNFLQERFTETGRYITVEAAELIVALVDCHPYYVQQLGQQAWLRTTNVCMPEVVSEAHASLVGQMSMLFTGMTARLTTQQVRLLHAAADGETEFGAKNVMRRYGLSSGTAVLRSKEALVRADILDQWGGKYAFLDPLYRWWLANCYFVGD